jgi:uncharacterized integral membrane protein
MRREPGPSDDRDGEPLPDFGYRRERRGFGATILIVTGILLVIFLLQNLDDANIDFLFWDWDVSIAWAILLSAALGFVLGWVVAWLRRRSRRA